MLVDAFACVNKKKIEQKLIRLGSKQGSIILCLFPGFAESFLAVGGCHSGRAAEHSISRLCSTRCMPMVSFYSRLCTPAAED